jgi:flagellar hook assembly protein FlgD
LGDGATASETGTIFLSHVLNFPNPFTSSTVFNVQCSRTSTVQIKIFDLRGNLVKTLDGQGSGSVQMSWNGKDDSGTSLPNGVYFYMVKATDTAGNTAVAKGKCAILK